MAATTLLRPTKMQQKEKWITFSELQRKTDASSVILSAKTSCFLTFVRNLLFVIPEFYIHVEVDGFAVF